MGRGGGGGERYNMADKLYLLFCIIRIRDGWRVQLPANSGNEKTNFSDPAVERCQR